MNNIKNIAIAVVILILTYFLGRWTKKCEVPDTSPLENEITLLNEQLRQKDLEYAELKKLDSTLTENIKRQEPLFKETHEKVKNKINKGIDSLEYWEAIQKINKQNF